MPISRGSEEFIWLAEATVEDIRFAKRHTWALTYYVLLTHAAIITLYVLIYKNVNSVFQNFPKEMWVDSVLFWLPSYVINLVGNYHLLDINRSLSFYRIRLSILKNKMGKPTKEVFDVYTGEDENYFKFTRYFWRLTFFFILLLNLSSLFILLMVLCKHNVEPIMLWIVFVCISSFIINYVWFSCLNDKVNHTIRDNRRDLI